MTYATLSPSEASFTFHPDLPDLKRLQELCEGYVETIKLPDLPGVMWCDEDAKSSRKTTNYIATELAGAQLNPWDHVAGTIVITGPADRAGNITSLTSAAVDLLADGWPR